MENINLGNELLIEKETEEEKAQHKKIVQELIAQTPQDLKSFQNQLENRRNQSLLIEALEYTPIKAAIETWLSNLRPGTRQNYGYYMHDMIKRRIIPEFDASGKDFTVGHFRHVPHELVLDYIKKIEGWSEGTRQLHCACYISFTAYLSRISQGWFRRAIPSNLATNPTFFQVREKCATNAMTLSELHRFIKALHCINKRDSLIARTIFHGAKRVSEVLSATLDQIDWEKNIILFQLSKTGGMIKKIPITYPQHYMDELKDYINATDAKRTDGSIFISRNGKRLTRVRLSYSFEKAGKNAHIKNKVTPHVLRASWVTIVKQQGVQDTEIMKCTGHTSSAMIFQYDKSSAEDNPSKKFIFI